jgi:hypothetical protein
LEPPPADADALALSLAAALSEGAALEAEGAAPPLLQAAIRMAAVAPSDSSRIELRKVSPPHRTAGTMTDPRSSGREDTLSHERRR